jgi:hypothetical protein
MVDHSRMPRLILAVIGVLVAVIGAAGVALGHGSTTTFIGLRLSEAHSIFLLIAGVLTVLFMAVRKLSTAWAMALFAIFCGVFCYGVAEPDSMSLNLGDHVLHLVVITFASVSLLLVAAPFMGSDRH